MNTATKTTDVTDLTNAALDVVIAVKTGEPVVDVDALSPAERLAVCKALNIQAPAHWIMNSYPAPNANRGRYIGPDYEALALDEQEDDGRNVG